MDSGSVDRGAEAQLRLFHRQMYVDLVRAYLRDYGSQGDLARALGVTEAYLSFLLEPVRTEGMTRRAARWTAALLAPRPELAEAVKFLKSPSEERARQIAGQLCSDRDRRDRLQYHLDQTRRPDPARRGPEAVLAAGEAAAALAEVGELHQVALFSASTDASSRAYLDVWSRADRIARSLRPSRTPVPYAQALMYRHDAAQVFNRPDLALGYARSALLALTAAGPGRPGGEAAVRLHLNALLAEAVSLNTLGLASAAMAAIRQAETAPGYRNEPESWLRSFLEQQLTAMTYSRRLSVYDAEKIADHAAGLVPADLVLRAGISRRLLDVYTVHGTARSARKASELAGRLAGQASGAGRLTPVRRAQILRSLYAYYRSAGDQESASRAFLAGMSVTVQANLFHQQKELLRISA